MYAGRVACRLLVSHGEYANGTDKQRDRRKTVTLRLLLDAARVKSPHMQWVWQENN